MIILSRYLIKEVCHTLLAVTLVLLLVFLSNQLVRFLSYAASGKIAANVVFQFMGFEIAFLLVLLLPLGLYLGVIITYGRLYADNELRVMQAYGLSTRKLVWITSGLAAGVSFSVMVLTLWVNPLIAVEKNKLIARSIAASNILNTLMPGRFQVTGDDNRVIYVESMARNHQKAQNIFVAEQKKPLAGDSIRAWTVLSAAQGYQRRDQATQDRFVVAVDGYRYEGTPGQNAYKIIKFKKYAVRIPEQSMELPHQAQEVIPTRVLLQHYYQNPRNAAELQWRFSMPLLAFLLAMLAVPLSYLRPRQSRYARLFPALLIYIIYIELLFVARDWVEQKMLPINLGLGWVHGLLALLVIFLLLRQTGKFWVRKKQ
jgi:lipopolysaccharide export system permease protein